MRNYVCHVTSTHPIDLFALVVQRVFFPAEKATLKLLVSSPTYGVQDPSKRRYAPFLALPLPIIAANEGVMRQCHAPVDEGLDVALREWGEAWIKVLPAALGDDAIKERLRMFAAQDVASTSSCVEIIQKLITASVLSLVDVKIANLDCDRKTNSNFDLGDLVQIVAKHAHVLPKYRRFKMSKGGGLCLLFGETRVVFESGFTTNEGISLQTSIGSHSLTLSKGNLTADFEIDEVTKCWLQGPIENLISNQYGELCHLPWYVSEATIVTRKDKVDDLVREVISPITSASATRSPFFSDATNRRLRPTGYCLFDYQTPYVLRLLRSLFRDESLEFVKFADWELLTINHPVARQKGLKHQGGVVEYTQKKLVRLKRQRSPRELAHSLNTNWDHLGFVEYGEKLSELAALIMWLEQIAATNSIGLHSIILPLWEGEFQSGDDLISRIDAIVEAVETGFLKLVSILPIFANGADSGNVADQLKKKISFHPKNLLKFPNRLWQRRRHLRNMLHLYYQLVIALCNGPLKMNVLFASVFLGRDETLAAIRALKRRRGANSLWITPIYLQLSDEPSKRSE